MAEMVRSDLEALGFRETAVVPTDGHPGVWGYYDAGADRTLMVYLMYDVQPVNPEDWRSPPFEERLRTADGAFFLFNSQGVERWIDGVTGRDAIMRYLYHPTLNIDGIWGGYAGEGVKTILPHRATAKVDSRLPYGLHSDTALALIRRHGEPAPHHVTGGNSDRSPPAARAAPSALRAASIRSSRSFICSS